MRNLNVTLACVQFLNETTIVITEYNTGFSLCLASIIHTLDLQIIKLTFAKNVGCFNASKHFLGGLLINGKRLRNYNH